MRRWRWWRRGGVVSREGGVTFVMDAEWERSEELRPSRLGPGPDDLSDDELWEPVRKLPRGETRPRRTLD